jgi:hypothetical protein
MPDPFFGIRRGVIESDSRLAGARRRYDDGQFLLVCLSPITPPKILLASGFGNFRHLVLDHQIQVPGMMMDEGPVYDLLSYDVVVRFLQEWW